MEKIAVLDMGGQYCHLIARRIRQLNVFSEIHPSDVSSKKLKGYKGIILSGGPDSVYEKGSPQVDEKIFDLGIPILGLCYGHHLITQKLGGIVKPGKVKEYGAAELTKVKDNVLFKGLSDRETVWMSHGDWSEKLPPGFEIIGSTGDCKTAAVANTKRSIFGIQFHPEVTHTPNGMKILDNFLNICGCKRDWKIKDFLAYKMVEIKKEVNEKNVFLLVSGGVDSTVCFALLNRILGKAGVFGLHINNGLVRKNESVQVKASLKRLGFTNLEVVDASNVFLEAIEGIYEPEEKRRIIGEKFIEVQKLILAKHNLDPAKWLLGQGTIYPDTIETAGTKNADLIKTHHNRVPLIQAMIKKGLVIEPLKDLYKDEVRELGELLGLPHDLVWRHPFPGPGLGVRCLCSKGTEKVTEHKDVKKFMKDQSLVGGILPIKSVGVQGDARTYRHPAYVFADIDWPNLERLSTDLTNRFKSVNRTLLLLAPTKLDGFKLKKAHITGSRVLLLQEADDIVTKILRRYDLYDSVWQFPVVLIPYGMKGESIILRPVDSKEAMTASFYRLPIPVVKEMTKALVDLPGIDAVFYDITNKPPATIEWE